jgi:hypothetical protein
MENHQPLKLVYRLKQVSGDRPGEKEINLTQLHPPGCVFRGPEQAHTISTNTKLILELELKDQERQYQRQCTWAKWGFSLIGNVYEPQNLCRYEAPELMIFHKGRTFSAHSEAILLEAPCSKTNFAIDWRFLPHEPWKGLDLIVTYNSNPASLCCSHNLTAVIPLKLEPWLEPWRRSN